jgi:acyl-coenzyme A thioesterase PaaI-like protein
MGGEHGDQEQRRTLAARVAGDLRAIIANLSEREIADADLAAAAQLGAELRQRLDGPRRPRWYEGDAMQLADEDRFAYLDQSPIRGRLNPIAPPLLIDIVERDDGTRRVVGRTTLGPAYEGPPHGVHGGWVAALFDELLGMAQGLGETKGVTATLKVRYRHVTPIEEALRLEGWIHEDRGRTLICRGTCHAGDTLTADAEGLFVRVDFNEIQDRMKLRRGD